MVRGPLTVVASPVVEHRLRTRRPSGHGSRVQPLHGTWDIPGPGHEPASPASAGRLSTTAPPGKPQESFFCLGLHFSALLSSLLASSSGKLFPYMATHTPKLDHSSLANSLGKVLLSSVLRGIPGLSLIGPTLSPCICHTLILNSSSGLCSPPEEGS